MTAPTARETADHAELKRLAEVAAPYWHAVNLACGGNPIAVDLVAPFVGAMSPATVLALLSEIAALRGERDGLMATRRWNVIEAGPDLHVCDGDHEKSDRCDYQIFVPLDRSTQAERQRDELREALEPFAVAAANFDENDTCDAEPDDYVFTDFNCLSVGHLRAARQAIANQGADQ